MIAVKKFIKSHLRRKPHSDEKIKVDEHTKTIHISEKTAYGTKESTVPVDYYQPSKAGIDGMRKNSQEIILSARNIEDSFRKEYDYKIYNLSPRDIRTVSSSSEKISALLRKYHKFSYDAKATKSIRKEILSELDKIDEASIRLENGYRYLDGNTSDFKSIKENTNQMRLFLK